MGLIQRVFGGTRAVEALSDSAGDLIEVFHPNATREMELAHGAMAAVQDSYASEFAHAGATWFDRAVNGLNRLPRPAMALGTVGLFAFAMADPDAFARRMQGLGQVPDPLWWLLGAIVSFYFGARELHYRRAEQAARGATLVGRALRRRSAGADGFDDNPALAAWARDAVR